jgi:hypothetical protein
VIEDAFCIDNTSTLRSHSFVNATLTARRVGTLVVRTDRGELGGVGYLGRIT